MYFSHLPVYNLIMSGVTCRAKPVRRGGSQAEAGAEMQVGLLRYSRLHRSVRRRAGTQSGTDFAASRRWPRPVHRHRGQSVGTHTSGEPLCCRHASGLATSAVSCTSTWAAQARLASLRLLYLSCACPLCIVVFRRPGRHGIVPASGRRRAGLHARLSQAPAS
jgi:hypothetical protein